MTTDSIPVVTEPDAGQQLLDQLGLDAQPIQPSDQHLYAQGCLVSALALHIPPGRYTSVALLTPPGDEGPEVEVRCSTAQAAAEVAAALPWPHPPITRAEPGELHTHHVTRGVLWGNRIAVVGLAPAGGAS